MWGPLFVAFAKHGALEHTLVRPPVSADREDGPLHTYPHTARDQDVGQTMSGFGFGVRGGTGDPIGG